MHPRAGSLLLHDVVFFVIGCGRGYVSLMCLVYSVLSVGGPPELLEELRDMVALKKDDATLQCSINPGDPRADIHWFKDNKEIYKGKKYTMSYEEDSACLTISATDTKDAGVYRCEASNKLGRVQTQCKLAVQAAPKITYEEKLTKAQHFKAGATMILSVNISGLPVPKVSWYFGEETIVVGNGVSVETTDTFSTLTLKGVSGLNTGTFKVTAENEVGSDSAEFTVQIKDKPSPPANFRVKEVFKDYVVVAWDAPESDGGSPITGYTVEKRDARKTTSVKAGTVGADTFELKVTKLVEGNEYVFQVCAENEIGLSEPTTMEPVKARLPFGKFSKCYRESILTTIHSVLSAYLLSPLLNVSSLRVFDLALL